eukprot:scaffold9354_cov88-Skeletonema_dohrnii-CCMP3373.AAC.3
METMMFILWRQPIQGYEPNLGAAAASGSLVVSSLTKRNECPLSVGARTEEVLLQCKWVPSRSVEARGSASTAR